MKNAVIISHQGWADLFSNNGLYNYYANQYDELVIFVSSLGRKKMLEAVFSDQPKIKVDLPIYHHIYDGLGSCFTCHSLGHPDGCPREPHRKCDYIDESKYWGYDLIKIASFDDYNRWETFRADQFGKNLSFSHCFYLYRGIDLTHRVNLFSCFRNIELEERLYQKYAPFGGASYILIHEDPVRRLLIDRKRISGKLPIINLNNISEIMIDVVKLVSHAVEIHMIDSNYSLMIYFMSFKIDEVRSRKKFLHVYGRKGRDILIYTQPTPDNWVVVR